MRRGWERNYPESVRRAVEGCKNAPDIEKAKALFRSPVAAAHLQWLLDKRKSEIKDNAPELAPADGASE